MALDKFTIGRRYANALFELAESKQALDDTYQELLGIRQIFTENKDLGNVLTDMRLSLAEKKPIIDSLKQQFSPLMQTFLQMVFDYKRMNDILFMVDYFEAMYDKQNKIIRAEVTTAVALNAAQQEKLSAQIAQRFGASHVQITSTVDPDIIGGVIVHASDKVIDGSIKTRLTRIKALLLNR
ncbi:H(+)-transporting ATPase F(1) delta subunit [Agrilactobacillus composti DSM 18527 = JCM 14202]|uniref:ATP synthase subunit delta n=1 Tax=Agrilactobacillus composti DSM 18527 = JCM 14202 TaxID=1423734 RepID=X0PF91_9LACO|nr:ATP synthase F1 subunit delta [Agrilactobacillus composti]KRM36706.1 H(+)-transporting ATPase F(1) delta subunit [Agrilactobacillus composti DSM 18527 = JCM 14202]GAF40534.1 ATP synthase delta chain [Agrilactobacillus composti DSM 18527 = JCM 14202]